MNVRAPTSVDNGHAVADRRELQGENTVPVADRITVTDFARLALLTPPQDTSRLAELRQRIHSGEYGPPAAAVAEALITIAIGRGLKLPS